MNKLDLSQRTEAQRRAFAAAVDAICEELEISKTLHLSSPAQWKAVVDELQRRLDFYRERAEEAPHWKLAARILKIQRVSREIYKQTMGKEPWEN